MNFEKKSLINAIVDYYDVSFTFAEDFVNRVTTKSGLEKVAQPVITLNSTFVDVDKERLLKEWRDSVLKRMKDSE